MQFLKKSFAFWPVVILLACGGSKPESESARLLSKGDYQLAILHLRSLESERPEDATVKRDLGIAYFKSGQIERAATKLQEAQQYAARDPLTSFFLGLCHESLGAYTNAAEAYRDCMASTQKPLLRRELQARISKAETQGMRQTQNSSSSGQEPPPNSLAVLYFRNVHEWEELAPVVKGLSELLAMDFAQIDILDVMPRAQLESFLTHHKMNIEQMYDKTRLPETAKTLGVRYVISGGIERTSETRVRLSAGVVNSQTGKLIGDGASVEGKVSELPSLQKQLLMDLIGDMHLSINDKVRQDIREPETSSSLAFIAYSKGIDFEDRGQQKQAKEHFKEALKEDPKFLLAKQKLQDKAHKRLGDDEVERMLLKELGS